MLLRLRQSSEGRQKRKYIYKVEKQCIPPTEKNLSPGELGQILKSILDIGI
jgi:hypothetical protein